MADTHTFINRFTLGVPVYFGLTFNSLGTRAYVIGLVSYVVHEIALSTPWDLGTASFTGVTADVGFPLEHNSLFLARDESSLYMPIFHGNTLRQWSMASGLAAITLTRSVSFTATGGGYIWSCFIGENGTKMLLAFSSGKLCQYDLSVAGNISTATKISEISFGSSENQIWASDNGRMVISVSSSYNVIFKIILENPWDLTSVILNESNAIIIAQPVGVFCNHPDEDKVYVTKQDGIGGSQYVIDAFTITPAPYEFWTNFKGQTELIV